jgi:hypothetical protein
MKRFDFDLEYLQRSKITDYVEFPMKLNLEPYTKGTDHLIVYFFCFVFCISFFRLILLFCYFLLSLSLSYSLLTLLEGLERKESNNPVPLYPAEYYEYNLCGVLIHTGMTTDSGHYYSFIKDRYAVD